MTASCWLTLSTVVITTGKSGRRASCGACSCRTPLRQTAGPSSLRPSCPRTDICFLPSGALTLGIIFVSGFMIIPTRNGLSTKQGPQTTPLEDSRYVAGGWEKKNIFIYFLFIFGKRKEWLERVIFHSLLSPDSCPLIFSSISFAIIWQRSRKVRSALKRSRRNWKKIC